VLDSVFAEPMTIGSSYIGGKALEAFFFVLISNLILVIIIRVKKYHTWHI
jgi:hypothetical protein